MYMYKYISRILYALSLIFKFKVLSYQHISSIPIVSCVFESTMLLLLYSIYVITI